jgi:hypothetical protein
MSDYSKIGEGLGKILKASFIIMCITVPLAAWKLIDIAIWLFNHIEIGVK